jgi:hypothetical protein
MMGIKIKLRKLAEKMILMKGQSLSRMFISVPLMLRLENISKNVVRSRESLFFLIKFKISQKGKHMIILKFLGLCTLSLPMLKQ